MENEVEKDVEGLAIEDEKDVEGLAIEDAADEDDLEKDVEDLAIEDAVDEDDPAGEDTEAEEFEEEQSVSPFRKALPPTPRAASPIHEGHGEPLPQTPTIWDIWPRTPTVAPQTPPFVAPPPAFARPRGVRDLDDAVWEFIAPEFEGCHKDRLVWKRFSFVYSHRAWQGECKYHKLNASSGCKKKIAVSSGDEKNCLVHYDVVRWLKHWASNGLSYDRQWKHIHTFICSYEEISRLVI